MLDRLLGMASGWASKAPTDDFWYLPRGQSVHAGVDVCEETALAFVTVYACVAKLAKTLATLPVSVIEKTGPRTRESVEHPLTDLLTGQTNPETNGMTFRETMIANLLLWGNAYAECIWSNDGRTILGLTPLMSKDVRVERNEDQELIYKHRPPGAGEPRYLPADRVWHVPGLSLNGITGLSPIACNRETIGIGMATKKFQASFFGNGTWAGGWIKRKADKELGTKPFSAEAGAKLMASVEEKLKGPDKAFSIFLLREDMEYHQHVAMPLKDAQFVEGQGLTRIDICGIFDVPPSKIHDLKEGTFNNTEQQDLGWAKDSILPWAVRLEMSAKARFFPREPLQLRHNLAGLMRGDIQSRYAAYATGRQWGWLSVNDIRELEDLNPVDGGNEYISPLNMVPLGTQRQELVSAPSRDHVLRIEHAAETRARKWDAAVFAELAADCARRLAAKEIKAVERNYQKKVAQGGDPESFKAWLDKFYSEHNTYFRGAVAPLLKTVEEACRVTVKPPAAELAEQYAEREYDTLHALLEQPGGVPALIESWKATKAEAIAEGLLAVFQNALGGKGDG